MKRKMCLDLGETRIGIAFSDLSCVIANGYETYHSSKNRVKDIQYILELYKQKECDALVLGLPLNMDGSEGERAAHARSFGVAVQKQCPDIEIIFQDERWSTVSAEKSLIEGGMRRDKRKEVVDKVAATLILQAYLDKFNKKGEKKMENKPIDYMEEEEIITFVDEDGTEVEYILLAEIDYGEKQYAVLQPAELPEGMEEDEVVICEIILNDDEEEEMVFVEDDEIADAIVDEYNRILESIEEEEEEEAEDEE